MKRKLLQINGPIGPIALKAFLKQAGVTATTAWRWRKRGWLRTVSISNRPYVLPADLEEFIRRASAGEFFRAPSGAAKTAAESRRAREGAGRENLA